MTAAHRAPKTPSLLGPFQPFALPSQRHRLAAAFETLLEGGFENLDLFIKGKVADAATIFEGRPSPATEDFALLAVCRQEETGAGLPKTLQSNGTSRTALKSCQHAWISPAAEARTAFWITKNQGPGER